MRADWEKNGKVVPLTELVCAEAPSPLHDFVRYWEARRGGEDMPAFADIDPIDIPWALSRIYVLRAVPDRDFVYRLAGEDISARYGQPLKGKRITDLFSVDSAAATLKRWRRAAEGPSGYYSHTQHTSIRGTAVTARRVLLPLGEDRTTADHLLGFTMFDEASRPERFSSGLVTRTLRWSDVRQ